MADVIQIFKWVEHIEKPDYNTASRQRIGAWESVKSKTGFLKNGIITLPAESRDELANQKPDLLIIQDIHNFDLLAKEKHVLTSNLLFKSFDISSKSRDFEIFKFIKNENGIMEIWLNYANSIGLPKRENHKIAELRLGKPIWYKINGKHDFTMTGRKQRSFAEFDYSIEFVGTAEAIEYKELNKIEIIKTIPAVDCKLIDERKILT